MRRTLTEMRVEQGMSLRGLQEETGIFAGDLSRIEQGKAMPTPAQIAILSDHFGVGLTDWRFVPGVEVADG